MQAARHIGFKARLAKIDWERMDRLPFPTICGLKEGGFAVLASYGHRTGEEGVSALLHYPTQGRPTRVSVEELRELLDGTAVHLASRASLIGELARFDFTWFIPAIIKYRRQLGEVLAASLFIQLFALLTPIFFQVVMDKVLVHRGLTMLDVIAVAFFGVVIFETVLSGLRAYLFTHTTNRIDVELGSRLFRHLLALPHAYFQARRVGDSVARVRELENIRSFLTNSTVTALLDFLFIFVFIAAMFFYSKTLTVVVLASLPFYVLLSFLITPVLRRRLQEKFSRGAENQAFLVETVNGVLTVKAHAVEPQMSQRWDKQLSAYVLASFKTSNLANIGSHGVQLVSKLTTVAILWWGAKAVISGEMTVGQLIAFNMLSGRVSQPMVRMAQLWQDFQQAGVSMKRLGDILNSPTEKPAGGHANLPALRGEVQFQNVNFRYPGSERRALSNLSFKASAGQRIGVVGRSGSGKSTLTKLIQRLHLAESGRVVVDGIDLNLADPAWLRRQIGVVLQENLLFNRSVRDNIALAMPGAPMEKIMHVADLAGANEFIMELGEGYETELGEHGATISGGQRQRIAIARALLTSPKILIFDEATSALDYESEHMIRRNMGEIAQGRTVFIISHRLSAVRDCDCIYVMENGEIVETGTHKELAVIVGGRYARLLALQAG